jgi:hypothetical protein
MASVARTNPTAVAINVLQSNFALKVFKCVLNNSGVAVARTAATATFLTDEIGTTGSLIQVKTAGLEMVFIGEGHALDVDIVAIRLGRIMGAGSVSGGVWTFTGGGTLTVTERTDLFGM